MENPQLIMLGTGNAVVTRCYNTCFILKDRGSMLLVDAGGGNGILQQLEKAGIRLGDIHDMFITHAHTDHILGAVWVTRVIMQEILKGKYSGVFNIYGHDKSIKVLTDICRMTLHRKYSECIGKTVLMHEVYDGERFQAGVFPMECFDVLLLVIQFHALFVNFPADRLPLGLFHRRDEWQCIFHKVYVCYGN